MKKYLLVEAVLCCMISAMAQMPKEGFSKQMNAYTEKLDSIDAGRYKYHFVYDNQYNVEKMEIKEGGDLFYFEFTYDSLNRLSSATQTDIDPDYSYRTEYVYDNLGRRSEALLCFLENGAVTDEAKTVYEYNEDNNVSIVKESFLNNGSWREESKKEFFYDDQLDIDEIVFWGTNSLGVWIPESKIVHTYDNHQNCIVSKQYYYDAEEWWLENEFSYYYDTTILSSNIAGLDFYFYNLYNINGINKFCRNKLLYSDDGWGKHDGQSERSQKIFYYSTITGIDEMPEILLNIWPNPVDEVLYLEAEELQQIEIFSLDGKCIMTIANSLESVNIRGLASGCYLLKATTKNGCVVTQKFMKQ